jgi:hypothetical protein
MKHEFGVKRTLQKVFWSSYAYSTPSFQAVGIFIPIWKRQQHASVKDLFHACETGNLASRTCRFGLFVAIYIMVTVTVTVTVRVAIIHFQACMDSQLRTWQDVTVYFVLFTVTVTVTDYLF